MEQYKWTTTKYVKKIHLTRTRKKCMFAMYVAYLQDSCMESGWLPGWRPGLSTEKNINEQREVEGELVSIIHIELIVMNVTFTVLQYFAE